MKISIQTTFGGDKDNYFNFKIHFLQARESLRKANLYLSPSVLPEVDRIVYQSMFHLRDVEFED